MRQAETESLEQACDRLRAEVRELREQATCQDREYADLLVRFEAERSRNKALLFNNDRLRTELKRARGDAAAPA